MKFDKSILSDINIFSDYVLIGCSGGPDSMALLHFLINNLDKKIVCCHVNHNIRKESALEEVFLRNFCKDNDVIFESMTIYNYNESNFENEARKKRYDFYFEMLNKYNSKFLFLAHHGDDLIETILMKIVRGSNLMGYASMEKVSKFKSFFIVRPFLVFTKEDLISYDRDVGIDFFIDNSNYDTVYTRNRYRKFILPLLKEEDSNVHLKFLNYSKTLHEYDYFVKDLVIDLASSRYVNSYLDISNLDNIHPFLLKNLIFYILNNLYDNKDSIVKSKHVDLILKMIYSKKPNSYINLPLGFVSKREYDRVYFGYPNYECKDYYIELNDSVTIGNHVISFIDSVNSFGNCVCKLRKDDVCFPLFIRNRKDGDYIYLMGSGGKKKVKDIFIEKKIPKEIRNGYPLVVDSLDRIIWIPNLKKSKFCIKNNEKCDIILKYCEKEENNEQ